MIIPDNVIDLLDCLQYPDTGEVHDLPTLMTKHQVVEINDPVQVTPKHLVILWDSQTEPKYQHQLNVSELASLLRAKPM